MLEIPSDNGIWSTTYVYVCLKRRDALERTVMAGIVHKNRDICRPTRSWTEDSNSLTATQQVALA